MALSGLLLYSLIIHLIRLYIKETGRKMSTDFQDTDAQKG
ncbi:hypothetical protein GCWU000341_00426 [Oribacterium sp. oral taxon 078 str. F0262]|nr:hypothetical protein GCWU000341_00426 [Oribacterium sp. oral taxon 078 str. F0262]